MNFCMKKIIISALLLLVAVTGYSQDRKWEHNIYVAGGLLIDREWGESETGVSMKLGYGLNYYFSEHWSMMPGIDIRMGQTLMILFSWMSLSWPNIMLTDGHSDLVLCSVSVYLTTLITSITTQPANSTARTRSKNSISACSPASSTRLAGISA